MINETSKKAIKQAIIIGLFLFLALYVYISGYLQYIFATIQCGRRPIIAEVHTYWRPDDPIYNEKGDFLSKYFCTEDQANQAGYNLDPFVQYLELQKKK